MARPQYEKTQSGNPHALPIMQHTFPVASIARFVDHNGRVSLYRISASQVRKAKPTDLIFCAKRSWDARAETGYMKQIEDKFQALAAFVIDGSLAVIEMPEKHIVDQFFALWKWRCIYKDKDPEDVKFNGLTGDTLTKDQEEKFEKIGVLYIRKGGVSPARQMHGIQIQSSIIREMPRLKNVQWNITQTAEGQFIVPDFITTTFIPLTPRLALCGSPCALPGVNGVLKSDVAKINQHLRKQSKAYYFANDLRACF